MSIKANKLTAWGLAYVLQAVGRKITKYHRAKQTSHGRQAMGQLMGHGVATNSIEVRAPAPSDRVARKWNVDCTFYQVVPDKHLLFFEARQVDAVTTCFSEHSRQLPKRIKSAKVLIREQIKEIAAEAARQPVQKLEHAKEVVYEDRQRQKICNTKHPLFVCIVGLPRAGDNLPAGYWHGLPP